MIVPTPVASFPLSRPGESGAMGLPIAANRISILSDLSANLFAALLLILILLLQAKAAAGHVDASGRRPGEQPAADRVGPVEHKPLQPAETIDLLRQRRSASPGLGLDLTQRGVIVSGAGAGRLAEIELDGMQPRTTLDEALGSAWGREPIRLYVFANRGYGPLTRELEAKGVTWIEMSVPQALRAADSDDHWSAAFRDLIAAPIGLPEFRAGLAQLLAGTRGPLVPDGRAIARSGAAAPQEPPPGSSPRDVRGLLGAILVVLRFLVLGAAIAFVLFIEIIVPDRISSYDRPDWLDFARPEGTRS